MLRLSDFYTLFLCSSRRWVNEENSRRVMVCQEAAGCSDKCPERNIKEQRNDSVEANEFRSRYEMAVTGRFSITVAKNVEKYAGSVLLLTTNTTLTNIDHIRNLHSQRYFTMLDILSYTWNYVAWSC